MSPFPHLLSLTSLPGFTSLSSLEPSRFCYEYSICNVIVIVIYAH